MIGDNAATSSLSFLFGLMPDVIGAGDTAAKLYPLLGLACNLGQLLGSSFAASKALGGNGLIFLAVCFAWGARKCCQLATARLAVSASHEKLVTGGDRAAICDRCVVLCVEVLRGAGLSIETDGATGGE